ncbi:MAG: hypothetical protein GMKNLPBB_02774 [Myxococcota bacterium]|nr:hypothetical protein [Myxococcota bacterium]
MTSRRLQQNSAAALTIILLSALAQNCGSCGEAEAPAPPPTPPPVRKPIRFVAGPSLPAAAGTLEQPAQRIAMTEKGDILAAAAGSTPWLLDPAGALPPRRLEDKHGAPITGLVLDTARNALYSGDEKGKLNRWDLQTATWSRKLRGVAGRVTALLPSANGKLLYVASWLSDRRAMLQAASTEQENILWIHNAGPSPIHSLMEDAGQGRLHALDAGRNLFTLRAQDGVRLQYAPGNPSGPVPSVLDNPNQRLLWIAQAGGESLGLDAKPLQAGGKTTRLLPMSGAWDFILRWSPHGWTGLRTPASPQEPLPFTAMVPASSGQQFEVWAGRLPRGRILDIASARGMLVVSGDPDGIHAFGPNGKWLWKIPVTPPAPVEAAWVDDQSAMVVRRGAPVLWSTRREGAEAIRAISSPEVVLQGVRDNKPIELPGAAGFHARFCAQDAGATSPSCSIPRVVLMTPPVPLGTDRAAAADTLRSLLLFHPHTGAILRKGSPLGALEFAPQHLWPCGTTHVALTGDGPGVEIAAADGDSSRAVGSVGNQPGYLPRPVSVACDDQGQRMAVVSEGQDSPAVVFVDPGQGAVKKVITGFASAPVSLAFTRIHDELVLLALMENGEIAARDGVTGEPWPLLAPPQMTGARIIAAHPASSLLLAAWPDGRAAVWKLEAE